MSIGEREIVMAHLIARVWRGRTPAAKADAYYEILQQTGLKEYQATAGNQGVRVLRRMDGDEAEFVLISFWESEEAIRRFAGDDIERAFYYPEDDDFLLTFEPTVIHYEVLD